MDDKPNRRVEPEPIPVTLANPKVVDIQPTEGAVFEAHITNPGAASGPAHQNQTADPSLPARTTFQEDLTYAGQRRVNLIWEYTQAVVALMVVFSTMIAGIYSMVWPTVAIGTGTAQFQIPVQIPTILSVAFGTVVGFYFSRTNHAAIGGVGGKPSQAYEGR